MPLLHTIALLAQRLFTAEKPFHSSDALTDSIIALINKVNLPILNISLPPRDPIEYYSIFASDALTICVFVMQKGATMPTHDHPEMTVFSKIVSGSMHVRTYEFVDAPPQHTSSQHHTHSPLQPSSASARPISPEYAYLATPHQQDDALLSAATSTSSASSTSSSSSSSASPSISFSSCSDNGGVGRLAKVSMDGVISSDSPDSLLIIRPDGGPNMHSFTAVSDYVVLLDIIGPPYNEDDRPCTYYKEVPLPHPYTNSFFVNSSGNDQAKRMVVKKRKDRASAPASLNRFTVADDTSMVEDEEMMYTRHGSNTSSLHLSLSSGALAHQAYAVASSPISPSSRLISKRSPPIFIPDHVSYLQSDAMDTNDEPRGRTSHRLSPPRLAWLLEDAEVEHDCVEMPYEGAAVHPHDLEKAVTARDVELLTL
ncbi:hypothetical protein BC829DRAFT_391163 [Chytridium lagenaria]|nr:hypothetical protein BC829DRAFT_391163 [Chytridium lagenaria]